MINVRIIRMGRWWYVGFIEDDFRTILVASAGVTEDRARNKTLKQYDKKYRAGW